MCLLQVVYESFSFNEAPVNSPGKDFSLFLPLVVNHCFNEAPVNSPGKGALANLGGQPVSFTGFNEAPVNSPGKGALRVCWPLFAIELQ